MSHAADPAAPRATLREEAPDEKPTSGVALRLAIGKDGLGIELASPAPLGFVEVVELVIRLPRVRFPFDVTGGVARFRHRRGELERIAVELDARRAARLAEPLLRGLLGTGPCAVTVAPRAFGATVSIQTAGRALAFEVAIAAGAELALVVHDARGANLPAPATQLALQAMGRLLGEARREGARFVVARAAERLARALLPEAGVRAPSGADVALVGCGESDGVLYVAFARGREAEALPAAAALANEAALLARAGDDARASGELDRARRFDVAALERSPGHPQIARRIAELDAHAGGRAEAAVAILRAADRTPYLGTLFGELLHETGDPAGAIASLLREGERDPSSPVAALAYARAAELATDAADALAWLDRAVARAPALAELRWVRAERRLVQGRLKDARADFQELEAMAVGAHERWGVLRRAADIHRARGLRVEAALLYERALLYRPDDADAVAGLGVAIAKEGRAARGATLLARAIELKGEPWMLLELARILAEDLGDRPAAVARLRDVNDDADVAVDARGLEARYRAALGDAAGASLAWARLRERAGRSPAAIPWLEEAASFEEERGELALAQAHLAAARAIDPHHAEVEARHRAVSERLARAAGVRPLEVIRPPSGSALEEPRPARDRATMAAPGDEQARLRETLAAPEEAEASAAPAPAPAASPEQDEARVEVLTRLLQGDPTNDAVVDELTERLTRLGRSLELLALLSARLEDAPPDRRSELLPRHREVLARLEEEARAEGREGEADLFKMAREASVD